MGTRGASLLAAVRQPWRVLSRPVLSRALALGVALAIPAFVLSAGNGLRAVDVLACLHRSLPVRSALWAGWLVLSAPAIRSVFVAPGSLSLRALRVSRGPFLFSLFALCATVEVPWVVLFARGAGWLEAWGALTASVALSSAAVSVWARPRWGVLLACSLAALAIAWDPPPLAFATLATICVPFGLGVALRDALEKPGSRFKLTRPGSALAALYLGHLLRLLRNERSRASVALGAVAAGAAGAVLSLRNDPSERPVQRALIVMALPLTVAVAACVAPLLENERRTQPVLRSLRVRRRVILLAFSCAAVTPASALAATSGVAIGVGARLDGMPIALALAAWAITLGCTISVWSRLIEQRSQRGPGTFVAGVTLIAVLATIGAAAW